jgi:ribosomal peptide maturation radical SAM protein 1
MGSQKKLDVVLISMPWSILTQPSIQLGLLKSQLVLAGLSTISKHLNIAFFDFLIEHFGTDFLSFQEYSNFTERDVAGIGEWIFAVPPYKSESIEKRIEYLDYAKHFINKNANIKKNNIDQLLEKAGQIKNAVGLYLSRCVDVVSDLNPQVVGFTISFTQRVPSLVLAKLLKDKHLEIKIVFGGVNCRYPMGEALQQAFPWIDAVIMSEAESIATGVFQKLIKDDPLPLLSGLAFRQNECVQCKPDTGLHLTKLDESPLPDYDDFFYELRKSQIDPSEIRIQIPYESARGCYWGQKKKCLFCGDRGASLEYRTRNADLVLKHLIALAKKHRILNLFFVDNVLNPDYLDSLFPCMQETGIDFALFCEARPTLTYEQLKTLYRAGMTTIQTGIESLSTPILKMMHKGTSAIANIRFLKNCAQVGITVLWHLLYGLPGEDPAEYDLMANLMLSLTHLDPPATACHRFHLDRYSAYHEHPEKYGLEAVQPAKFHSYIYPANQSILSRLAYFFEFKYEDGRDPETYIKQCRRVVNCWRDDYNYNYRSLTYRQGPDFIEITDQRTSTTLKKATYILDEFESQIFLECENGASPAKILAKVQPNTRRLIRVEEIQSFLNTLVTKRLAYEENGQYLSLALLDK